LLSPLKGRYSPGEVRECREGLARAVEDVERVGECCEAAGKIGERWKRKKGRRGQRREKKSQQRFYAEKMVAG